MLSTVGWVGSICFGLCVLPQCLKVYQTKSTKDLSWAMFGLWFVGVVFSFIYVLGANLASGIYQTPILINYVFNFMCLSHLMISKLIYDKPPINSTISRTEALKLSQQITKKKMKEKYGKSN